MLLTVWLYLVAAIGIKLFIMNKKEIQAYKDNRNLEKGFNAYWWRTKRNRSSRKPTFPPWKTLSTTEKNKDSKMISRQIFPSAYGFGLRLKGDVIPTCLLSLFIVVKFVGSKLHLKTFTTFSIANYEMYRLKMYKAAYVLQRWV